MKIQPIKNDNVGFKQKQKTPPFYQYLPQPYKGKIAYLVLKYKE